MHGSMRHTPIEDANRLIETHCASEALAGLQLADPLLANIRCFSESAPDATIHFQIIDLGQQLYIWMAVGGAKFQNLFLAIHSKLDPNPSVATLLPDGASSGAAAMAQRLGGLDGHPQLAKGLLAHYGQTNQQELHMCQQTKTAAHAAAAAAAAAAATGRAAAIGFGIGFGPAAPLQNSGPRRIGRPVVCSCNITANADVLLVFAERRLCQELESMGLGRSTSSSAPAAPAAESPASL